LSAWKLPEAHDNAFQIKVPRADPFSFASWALGNKLGQGIS